MSTRKNSSSQETADVIKLSERARFTGRKILCLPNEAGHHDKIRSLAKKTKLNIANSRDFAGIQEDYKQAFTDGDGIYFDRLKIAVINERAGDEAGVSELGMEVGITTEPERYVYALPQPFGEAELISETKIGAADKQLQTWGVVAVNLGQGPIHGQGINIAVLDTGVNLSHPDFAGLNIQYKSFINNQPVEDRHGHGTHCCGIAAAAIQQGSGLRYGIANGANLFVGKVLSNEGSGEDAGILAGIEWALENKCNVISMSLGSYVGPGETFSPAYENVALTALQNNCLIIAAAGNESQRQFGKIEPVGHPANCPSIMAVGALKENLQVADFSCGTINGNGGKVDIAGPGLNIYSSWKNGGYKTISGTSMATPFVAGIAASYFANNPTLNASDIWTLLSQKAKLLTLSPSDAGAGLVQAI